MYGDLHFLGAQTLPLPSSELSNARVLSPCHEGMDKMLVSGDGDVTVTNDGATILQKMVILFHFFNSKLSYVDYLYSNWLI